MFPQVAHPPRIPSQQFGGLGFATPPFDPLSTPRPPDRLAPLPFRSSRDQIPSSALAPPQRAYPVDNHGLHRPSFSRTNSLGHSYGRQYNDPSEHMLRRKTPNGTLAAGYDGTPVQWSSKAPALKHVVLPSSVGDISISNSVHPMTPDGHPTRQRSASLGWVHQQGQAGSFNTYKDARMNSDPGNWTQFSSAVDNPPNVWGNLWTNQPPTYYPNNGMQIPTVLQPSYQPAPGPTASNDGGLYGPYWPDGRFVPYRPAAYRGHQQPQNQDWDLNGHLQHSKPPLEILPPFQRSSFHVDSAPQAGNVSFYPENVNYQPEDRFATPLLSHPEHTQTAPYSTIPDGSRTSVGYSANRTANPHFKEKTLSWAHSIYVDLLAFLHQAKKESRQSKHSQGSRAYSKTSIYPKPPRQPASAHGTLHLASHEDNKSDPNSQHVGNTHAPQHRLGLSRGYSSWQGPGSLGESRYPKSANPEVSHYASPFQSVHNHPVSPINKAKEALEMLTNLCEQSGWCWVDGMLLGGCLAYGLEEYQKALDWYSKIIALDSK